MKPKSHATRTCINGIVLVISTLAASVAIFMLGWILLVILSRGGSALTADLFTQPMAPSGIEHQGVRNAIFGTLLITLLATFIGVPLGLLAGVFLAEFGRESRISSAVRFGANVLMGTPSIIVGIFVYALLVKPLGTYSGYAGAVALGVIMLPVVASATEEILGLVPNSLRESALALGAPRWRVTLSIVFRAAKRGLITGSLLAIARVSGETAPLLFTALNSQAWKATADPVGLVQSLGKPTANLTVTIYNYAQSPYEDWQAIAWGASLIITASVLLVMLVTRILLRNKA